MASYVARHRRPRFRRSTVKLAAASALLPLALPVAFAGPAEAASSACRSHELGAVFPHVRRTADQLACDFGIRTVGGHRGGAGDHGRGLAVDFMAVNTAQGDRLAAHARANASRYGIQYVMWNHRIWSAGRGDEGWRWVPDRGDRTANHMDHVHVSFSATPGNAVVTRATASQAPAERRTFTGAVRGVHVVRPGDTLSSIARRHRVSGGYAALFRANQTVVHDPHRIYVGQRLRLPR